MILNDALNFSFKLPKIFSKNGTILLQFEIITYAAPANNATPAIIGSIDTLAVTKLKAIARAPDANACNPPDNVNPLNPAANDIIPVTADFIPLNANIIVDRRRFNI